MKAESKKKYNLKERNKLVILVSGGRSSAMMAYHINTSDKFKKFEKLFLYTNTSLERTETIEFLNDIINYWGIDIHFVEGIYHKNTTSIISSKRVGIEQLKMKGEVFEDMIERQFLKNGHSLPNISAPFCSNLLKKQVANHYAKAYFGTPSYIKALGYRAEDMPQRITFKELQDNKYTIAPLLTDFEKPITQKDLTYFFEKQPFQLNLASGLGNCALCWKKSTKTLIKNIQYGNCNIEWMQAQEKKYNTTMYRERKSINDLVKLAESGTQLNLLDDIDDTCMCSF